MYHSSNYNVRTVFNNALYNSNSCIGYKMAHFRNTYAVDVTKHDPSFVFSRVKVTGTYNNIAHNATIDNLLTLFHVRSDISYIEEFDGSDIDDSIELVRLALTFFILFSHCFVSYRNCFFLNFTLPIVFYTSFISYIAKNYFP